MCKKIESEGNAMQKYTSKGINILMAVIKEIKGM